MTSDWLHAYLADSVRKDLCVKIHCTTCGAMEFRRGLLDALTQATGSNPRQKWDRESIIQVTKMLAHVTPSGSESSTLLPAVRWILNDLWSGIPVLDREIETLLGGTWAGDVLREMTAHHAAREAENRAREEYENPASVQKRREEKKRLKAEQHQERLRLKKERDRLWREKHPKGN